MYKLQYNYLSNYLSFLYLLSKSTRNKGRVNATFTGFELDDVMQFMGFRVFEFLNLYLEVKK